MRIAPVLALGLLPLLGGCQWLPWTAEPSAPTPVRLQGELSRAGEMLMLVTCNQQHRLLLLDAGQLGLDEAAARLQTGSTPLFADLGGQLDAAPQSGDGLYAVERLYRLQAEGRGCDDASFKRLIVHASGNEPGWSVRVSGGGMVLERPNAPPLALPYLEESLPDGRLSFSSEADGQRIELWLTPGRCEDSMSGTVSHLQARLRVNREAPLSGCAALGGARN
jgi:putative lipoprotein